MPHAKYNYLVGDWSQMKLHVYFKLWTPCLNPGLATTGSSSYQGSSLQSLVKIGSVVLYKVFKTFSTEAYVKLWTPLCSDCMDPRASICINLNLHVQLMFHAKFDCLVVAGCKKEDFNRFFPLKPILNFGPQALGPHEIPFSQT